MERLNALREQAGLTFTMLMDPDLETVKRWGVLNEESGKIPHPTAAIIDPHGRITYLRVDEDYKIRPSTADELLPELRKIQ